jgi:hypothetical protein
MRVVIALVVSAIALPLFAAEPDVAITAYVTARELVFEQVPNVTVTFRGSAENINVWKSDRTNLPDKVQPNVIYRDIGIRLTITSTLPNIEQIVDEALAASAKETESRLQPAETKPAKAPKPAKAGAPKPAEAGAPSSSPRRPRR